eukprot:CAMPEP_0182429060 /NCGR_PEP_ID=MMETSP1167-20130531/25481_1 /TAXON_ID=2988 /ORGANISM="Mallomonas Sp, Strain CCMP3275" /LENGTH=378 /DNA_ID=CAMNT_0024612367 /DNA_START=216 /DNA_END=1349 /DNA_ORIENTATION=-
MELSRGRICADADAGLNRALAARATRHLAARRLQRELAREKVARKERDREFLRKHMFMQSPPADETVEENDTKKDDKEITDIIEHYKNISCSEKEKSFSDTDSNGAILLNESPNDPASSSSSERNTSDSSSGWRSRLNRVLLSPSSTVVSTDSISSERDRDAHSSKDSSLETQTTYTTPPPPKLNQYTNSPLPRPPLEILGEEFHTALLNARRRQETPEDDNMSTTSSMSCSSSDISRNHSKSLEKAAKSSLKAQEQCSDITRTTPISNKSVLQVSPSFSSSSPTSHSNIPATSSPSNNLVTSAASPLLHTSSRSKDIYTRQYSSSAPCTPLVSNTSSMPEPVEKDKSIDSCSTRLSVDTINTVSSIDAFDTDSGRGW